MHTHATLLLELGGVVFALGVLGRLASSAGLSAVPLYLLAGLAFGRGGLLPLGASSTFLSTGADIGVVLLLLTLGLEHSAEELVGTLRGSAPAGLVDMVLNAVPGLAAGLLLGLGPLPAIALAGSTWVSSSGIASKLIGDLGWSARREVPAVIGVLVLEDLAMAVYLPVMTTVVAGVGLATGAIRVSAALAVLAVVMVVALRWGGRVSALVRGRGAPANDEVLLLLVLGLGLLVAGLAERTGVSAAVGAFLVGIALSGPVAHSARALLAPLRDLFAAVFFVFFGLRTDPATLVDVLLPGIALALVGAAGKLGTAWIATRKQDISRTARLQAGVLLTPRGEFSIVVAGLAVAAGADARLGGLVAVEVLLLATFAPLVAHLLQRHDERGRASPVHPPLRGLAA
ncbi:MAG TPA: cation:proton antiporter [Mycobacteriales bacterium]|nr:cation:proton antiporter [Mycobacteriales bacterium]